MQDWTYVFHECLVELASEVFKFKHVVQLYLMPLLMYLGLNPLPYFMLSNYRMYSCFLPHFLVRFHFIMFYHSVFLPADL